MIAYFNNALGFSSYAICLLNFLWDLREESWEEEWEGRNARTKTIVHRQRGAIFLVPRGM